MNKKNQLVQRRSPGIIRRQRIRLGYIPLIDCAPLAVAYELGFFKQFGLDVELSRELGWATIKEKLIYGELEAAHALAAMAFSIRLGQGCIPTNVVTALVLNLHGNGITLSNQLWQKGVRDAQSLRRLVRSELPSKMTFGIVSIYSSHHFLLRHWLTAAGLDVTRDVRLAVIPPAQMSRAILAGVLDGYCVGEPWNSAAVRAGVGWCAALSHEIAPGHPEKVLLVREDFAALRHEEHVALVAAVLEACRFCDDPSNRREVVQILARHRYVKASADVLAASLVGPFDFGNKRESAASSIHVFHSENANLPSPQKAAWILEQMEQCRLAPEGVTETDIAAKVFRPDLFQEASLLLKSADSHAAPTNA